MLAITLSVYIIPKKARHTWVDIYMLEEVLIHEVMVAFWMIAWYTNIFIHVESFHILERKLSLLVKLYEFLVHPKWSTPCIQKEM